MCNYDRAGVGWSDPSDRATQTEFVSDDLHNLVGSAGLKPPHEPQLNRLEAPGNTASLGDLPLAVLTRGRPSSQNDFPTPVSQAELDQVDQRWSTLQNELAALSTRASHRIVKDSGHAIPIQAPDAVVAAVRDIIDGRI